MKYIADGACCVTLFHGTFARRTKRSITHTFRGAQNCHKSSPHSDIFSRQFSTYSSNCRGLTQRDFNERHAIPISFLAEKGEKANLSSNIKIPIDHMSTAQS